MSRLATLGMALAALGSSCGAVQAKTCRISGDKLIEHANSLGFRSVAAPETGDGATCTARWPAVTVGAPLEADGHCRISYFEGAKLAPGWRMKGYALVGLPFRREAPEGSSGPPAFSVVATAPAGESGNLSLKTVTLDGPNCADWREALLP